MTVEDDTQIGKIIGSNSHIDYVGEVYPEKARKNSPDPTDYEFGQFVYIKKEINDETKAFIGVIYNTYIVDPDQGRTGPSLSQPDDQEIFHPGYVDEKRVITGIALLGCASVVDGELTEIDHSVPRWTLEIDDIVHKMTDDDLVAFHEVNGEIQLHYYQRMLDVAEGFAEDILSQIIDQLKQKKPEEADALNVIQKNLKWQSKMEGI